MDVKTLQDECVKIEGGKENVTAQNKGSRFTSRWPGSIPRIARGLVTKISRGAGRLFLNCMGRNRQKKSEEEASVHSADEPEAREPGTGVVPHTPKLDLAVVEHKAQDKAKNRATEKTKQMGPVCERMTYWPSMMGLSPAKNGDQFDINDERLFTHNRVQYWERTREYWCLLLGLRLITEVDSEGMSDSGNDDKDLSYRRARQIPKWGLAKNGVKWGGEDLFRNRRVQCITDGNMVPATTKDVVMNESGLRQCDDEAIESSFVSKA
ncbi:unnamed protein product [Agarophyton chilense]